MFFVMTQGDNCSLSDSGSNIHIKGNSQGDSASNSDSQWQQQWQQRQLWVVGTTAVMTAASVAATAMDTSNG